MSEATTVTEQPPFVPEEARLPLIVPTTPAGMPPTAQAFFAVVSATGALVRGFQQHGNGPARSWGKAGSEARVHSIACLSTRKGMVAQLADRARALARAADGVSGVPGWPGRRNRRQS